MTDILNKAIVLVLNRNWQAINIRTPQDAFCQMATNVATALDIEIEADPFRTPNSALRISGLRPVTWDEWITLPVRSQDNAVRTARGAVRVPTVIVAVNYARVPKKSDSYIIKVELNFAYLLQVLRQGKSQAKESLFVKQFKIHPSPLVRREIILAMADWGHNQWISDLKKRFKGLSRWERRAYIVASYYLTDEGQHWRKNNKSSFEPAEQVVRDWFADRFQTNQSVPQ